MIFLNTKMDTLMNIHDMGIGELRKILKDYDVKETSTSKDELIMQVTDVLLTELTIYDIMDSDTGNVSQDDVVTTDVVTTDVVTTDVVTTDVVTTDVVTTDVVTTHDESLTREQDIEYAEALRQDYLKQEGSFDELSPSSLREKRLAYYQ